MKCPQCAYENEAEALCCNLCQAVLRRETPQAAPAQEAQPSAALADGEPLKLTSGAEINGLILAALKMGAERINEAERLMTRLYKEVGILDCSEILVATCDAALKTSALSSVDKALVKAAIAAASRALEQGRLADAARAAQLAVHKLAETTPDAFRFQFILLGLRGAAKTAGDDLGEPRDIYTPVGLNALFIHAFALAQKKDQAAVERVMGRVFLELGGEFGSSLLRNLGQAWLSVSGLPPAKKDEAAALLEAAASAAARGDYANGFSAMQSLLKVGVPEQESGLRMAYLAIALRGAARGVPTAPPASTPTAAPKPQAAPGPAPAAIELNVDFGALIQPLKPPPKT